LADGDTVRAQMPLLLRSPDMVSILDTDTSQIRVERSVEVAAEVANPHGMVRIAEVANSHGLLRIPIPSDSNNLAWDFSSNSSD
jgi:hypothetical protein